MNYIAIILIDYYFGLINSAIKARENNLQLFILLLTQLKK